MTLLLAAQVSAKLLLPTLDSAAGAPCSSETRVLEFHSLVGVLMSAGLPRPSLVGVMTKLDDLASSCSL